MNICIDVGIFLASTAHNSVTGTRGTRLDADSVSAVRDRRALRLLKGRAESVLKQTTRKIVVTSILRPKWCLEWRELEP